MKKYYSLFIFILFICFIFNCSDSEDDSNPLSTNENEIVFTNISPSENTTIEDNDQISVEGTYTFYDFSESETYSIRLYLKKEIVSDTQTVWDLIDSAEITANSGPFSYQGILILLMSLYILMR